MQTLKEDIRERILVVAENKFYHNGYKDTTTRSIANEVGISVSNLYLYYKNKEDIFAAVSEEFYNSLINEINRFMDHNDRKTIVDIKLGQLIQKSIIADKKKFVIIADKSQGTKYECFKQKLISILYNHIISQVNNDLVQDPLISYILATNFIEGVIEIAKNSKDEDWLKNSLYTLVKYHMNGMQQLM